MRRELRVRLKRWLWWCAFALALLAGQTLYNARLPLGSSGTLWLAQWTVRLELGTTPTSAKGWRGHPWEVRAVRRNSGWIVEVGAGLIFAASGVVAVCAFFVRPRRVPPTLCWSCWYDLSALPPNIRKCPECGAEQEDEPV